MTVADIRKRLTVPCPLRTVGRQHASRSKPRQANLSCFAIVLFPGDLASSQRSKGVFMACSTQTNVSVTALIGAGVDASTQGVGEVLA